MKSTRLGLLAVSACSLFLLGCPTPVDMGDVDAGSGSGNGGNSGSGNGGNSGSGSGGNSGSGSGGNSGSGTGGNSGSGTGGNSGSGTGGSSGGNGGSTGTGGGAGSGMGGNSGPDAGGMGGAGGMAGPAGTKVPADVQAVFMKCGTACHGGNWGDATKSFARLKMNAMCGNMPRMKVSDGAGSLVVMKMKGPVAGCGAQMPLPANAMKLSAAEIKTVEDWITAGAVPVP